ncbi:MYO9B isoform 13, partial [Pongo abelii]
QERAVSRLHVDESPSRRTLAGACTCVSVSMCAWARLHAYVCMDTCPGAQRARVRQLPG